MNLLVKLGVGALGSWGLFKFFQKPSYQTITTTGPGGIPVKVATPVGTGVTISQATGQSNKPPTIGKVAPVPTTIPGKGVTYSPPGTVQPGGPGTPVQVAPIIITPAGAASIAVGSVLDVQRSLNTLGFCRPPLKEDGLLGPMTVACIKAFQSKYGLVVDGNAGPATKSALSAALTGLTSSTSAIGTAVQNSNPATGVTTVSTGAPMDTSAALKWGMVNVQHALNQLGASPPLVEDNRVGPKTVAAIKSFQTAHGLVPDGIAGPKTKTALYLATMQGGAMPALV